MDFFTSFKICRSGLDAQRVKLDTAISNLVNINTTRTAEGGPYQKKRVILAAEPVPGDFVSMFHEELRLVKVDELYSDKTAVKMIYDPSHPDADASGYVAMPDINIILEMAHMITANRSYEAIVTAFDATKQMALKSLELGK